MLRYVTCKNRRFAGTYRLRHHGKRIGELGFLRRVRRFLAAANNVPSWPILVTMMMEAISSSETSVLTSVTRRNIPEDGIFHSHKLLVMCIADMPQTSYLSSRNSSQRKFSNVCLVGVWSPFTRFEVSTAVTMKNCVFWDVIPCGSCENTTFRRNLAPPSSG
jgi:hypothetical protein